jgi:hypothetical protein
VLAVAMQKLHPLLKFWTDSPNNFLHFFICFLAVLHAGFRTVCHQSTNISHRVFWKTGTQSWLCITLVYWKSAILSWFNLKFVVFWCCWTGFQFCTLCVNSQLLHYILYLLMLPSFQLAMLHSLSLLYLGVLLPVECSICFWLKISSQIYQW